MLQIVDWNIEKMTGYKPITSFYRDFSVADNFGVDAIKDTYERAFEHWKNDYKYITELVMVLNWKTWEHNEKNDKLCRLYIDLFYALEDWCYENLEGEELSYFVKTTD